MTNPHDDDDMNSMPVLHTPPDRITWGLVKELFILDSQDDEGRWYFWPCVAFVDNRWERLHEPHDIASARQLCARLSAIHDRPVRDWTRPAPAALIRPEIVFAHLLGVLSDGEPTKMPEWGPGWDFTDSLFLDGGDDGDLMRELEAMRRPFIDAIAEGTATESQAIEALDIAKGEAIRRWRMLHAANGKPPYNPAAFDG
ncbi:hypothetical protein HW509_14140 [Asaia spathodeae]|uniref:hypothetical protein n=1 Tax=Asaia spathodeae TaxID=657016 RepID=UPI002FC27570